MSIKIRLAFLLMPIPSLRDRLVGAQSDLRGYFQPGQVVVTDELDYETYFEGWKSRVETSAKKFYVLDFVRTLEYTEDEMLSIFGGFESDLELFDKWWVLNELSCSEMPTDWRET